VEKKNFLGLTAHQRETFSCLHHSEAIRLAILAHELPSHVSAHSSFHFYEGIGKGGG
jgi:hypothetical protein